MKRVLLINEGGLGNLGDDAIRRCLEHLLRSRGCHVEWAAFSRAAPSRDTDTPRTPGGTFGLRRACKALVPVELAWLARYVWTYLPFVRSADYDLILIGGGQLIQSNRVFGLAMFLWVKLLQRARRRRIILLGVGVADRLTGWDRWLFRQSLRRVDEVYVRDQDSAAALTDLLDTPIKTCPDVAFCITELMPDDVPAERRALFCPVDYAFYARKKGPCRDRLNESQYCRYWADQVESYASRGYDVKLFCTSWRQDISFVERLRDDLAQARGVVVAVDTANTLAEVCGLIQTAEVVVAARMHALILAYAYGRDVVAFHTSEKIKAFEEEYLQSGKDSASVRRRIGDVLDHVVQAIQ